MYAHVCNFMFFQVAHPLLTISQDLLLCLSVSLSFTLPNCPKDSFWGDKQTLAVFFPPTGEYNSCKCGKTIGQLKRSFASASDFVPIQIIWRYSWLLCCNRAADGRRARFVVKVCVNMKPLRVFFDRGNADVSIVPIIFSARVRATRFQ